MKNFIGTSVFANLFVGIEAVGGKIYFDEKGLTFKSHALNIQTGQVTILYNQILSVQKRNTLGLIPNGFSIFTKDNLQYKFVVYRRSKIIEFLSSKV